MNGILANDSNNDFEIRGRETKVKRKVKGKETKKERGTAIAGVEEERKWREKRKGRK